MDRDALIERLRATFIIELNDHVKILEAELLALERKPSITTNNEKISNLFRSAHSLKGAARAVDLDLIESVCHRLEEIFADVRDHGRQLSSDVVQVLLRAVDSLKEAADRLQAKRPLTESSMVGIIPQLAMLVTNSPAGRRATNMPAPPARPLPPPPPSAALPPPPAPLQTHIPAPHSQTMPIAQPIVPDEAVSPSSQNQTIRVSAEKLDNLIARSGELLVSRGRLQLRLQALDELQEFAKRWRAEWRVPSPAARRHRETLKKFEGELQILSKTMTDDHHSLEETVLAVDTELRALRLLGFSEACEGLERMVRDLARSTGKQIALKLEGSDIQIDRSILDNLRDPLRHLVRNAVDHGIEKPEIRQAAGKPAEATITVRAALKGATVEVVVEDDGRGLDMAGIRAHAQSQNIDDLDDDRKLTRVIFFSGFSTSSSVTRLSGRGVGLDVVKSKVESIRGAIEVESTPSRGTRFILTLPLTLTVIRAILVRAADRTFAFDASAVERMVRIDPKQLRVANGCHVLPIGDDLIRVASLAQTLGLAHAGFDDRIKVPVISLVYGQRRGAFLVDELLSEQEIVIHGLGPRLLRVEYLSGATTMIDGTVVPVLNSVDLIDSILAASSAETLTKLARSAEPVKRKRLIVADDSVTTRTLEKSILEAAGYEVLAAADGLEAWRLIQEEGADLVVSDVEMPNMDGFSLTEAIRRSVQFRNLPVILVTARATDSDKMRGLEAGANAYIVKSSFDQKTLLDTVEQVL